MWMDLNGTDFLKNAPFMSTVFLRLNAAAFNRQGYCSAAAFIRGRRLIEGGVY